jgi:hypothetical protein
LSAPSAATTQAQPSAAGQSPRFPGLQADERNILVAPQGLILLAVEPGSAPVPPFNRLVRLLAPLSQTLVLPDQLSLYRRADRGDILVRLLPAPATGLSSFYDTASWVAGLVDARLYIGQEPTFIQYRDASAPRGYDAPPLQPAARGNTLRLVDQQGVSELPLDSFSEWPLAAVLLRIAPLPEPGGPLPAQVYALAPPALYPLLAPYFQAHHLHYRLAQLEGEAGALILFQLSPRPQAPSGHQVPAFILDYLTRLPRVCVLVVAHQSGDQCILLPWRHRYPLAIPHLTAAFAPAELVLLLADTYPSLRVRPVPPFVDGDLLAQVHIPRTEPQALIPQPVRSHRPLQLPVLLRTAEGPTPPIAAVLLNVRELTWLRPLLYRLPRASFRAWSLCAGQDRAVLVGGELPVDGIPFGLPLRRLGDTGLFIPLRRRLVPELPWEILRQVLDIQDGRYTFLTAEYRLDLPRVDFVPLSRVLTADPARPRISFQARLATGLSPLHWTTPQRPPQASAPVQEPHRGGIVKQPPEELPARQNLNSHWLAQARAWEAAGDDLAAAVCYSLLNDPVNSARCYRRAAKLTGE